MVIAVPPSPEPYPPLLSQLFYTIAVVNSPSVAFSVFSFSVSPAMTQCHISHISFSLFPSLDDTCERVDRQQQRLGHVFHQPHVFCFVQAEFHCPRLLQAVAGL